MHKYSCTITTDQDGWETNMEDGNRQLTAYEEELTFTKRNANKAHLNRCFYITSISRPLITKQQLQEQAHLTNFGISVQKIPN